MKRNSRGRQQRTATYQPPSDRESTTKGPQLMANVVAQLMARRGYNQLELSEARRALWCQVAGDRVASLSQPSQVVRGVWEIIVPSSVVVQELAFRKRELLKKIKENAPDEKIQDLKFRVGTINNRPNAAAQDAP